MKVDMEAKVQGLHLLPKDFFMFVIAKLRNTEFSFVKKNLFSCNLQQKRDRAALVGLPPAALGP